MSKYMLEIKDLIFEVDAENNKKQIIKGLNEVLTADTQCMVALETMAGKGNEIGKTFEELDLEYENFMKTLL